MSLRFPDKISAKQAGKKVTDFLLHADSLISPRPRNREQIQAFVDHIAKETGTLLVQEARHYRSPLPYIENMSDGSTWQLSAGASVRDSETGETIGVGPGEVSVCAHLTLFEKACAARERAVEQSSYVELINAVSLAQSSIEGFANYLAAKWNRAHPDAQLLDTPIHRVTIKEKIHEWYPRITGSRLSKNAPIWQKFVALKKLRDDMGVHPKDAYYGISYKRLARRIDDFRDGIALLLGQLHLRAGYRIPQVIVKAYYYPSVEVVEG